MSWVYGKDGFQIRPETVKGTCVLRKLSGSDFHTNVVPASLQRRPEHQTLKTPVHRRRSESTCTLHAAPIETVQQQFSQLLLVHFHNGKELHNHTTHRPYF